MDYSTLPQGIDVSHWNGQISWAKMADDGVAFAYIKVDSMFATNAQAAQTAGILTLAYAFMGEMGVEEFKSRVGDMAVVLDCEVAGIEESVREYLDGLEGRPMLNYTGIYPPFAAPEALWTLPRILPEYSSAPRLKMWDGISPPDWKSEWLIWQRSSTETFSGETGNFDLDVLGIPLDRFRGWCSTGIFA